RSSCGSARGAPTSSSRPAAASARSRRPSTSRSCSRSTSSGKCRRSSMTLLRRAALALALAVACLAVTRPAAAAAPLDQLKMQIDRVLKVVDDPELRNQAKVKERRAAVRKIANDIFDFGETARRSLGRHWVAGTPTEQAALVERFSVLLVRSYFSKIEPYGAV